MDLGVVLVVIGLFLALISMLVDRYRFNVLAIGVIFIGVGVLVGVNQAIH